MPVNEHPLIVHRFGQPFREHEVPSAPHFQASNIPSVRAIRKRLAELKRIDLANADIGILKERLAFVLHGFSVVGPEYETTHMFYRGRLMNQPPLHSSQVSAPPPETQLKFGRLNRPGQSLLYVNMQPGSLVRELKGQPGHTMAIASYMATRPLMCLSAGFDPGAMSRRGFDRTLPRWSYSKEGVLSQAQYQIVAKFISDEMLKDVPENKEYLYKLSVAWAELVLTPSQCIGMEYPSVANDAKTNNVAFRPEVVGNGLELKRVDFVRAEEVHGDTSRYTFISSAAAAEDGTLCYRPFKGFKQCVDDLASRRGLPALVLNKWVVRDESDNSVIEYEIDDD